MSTSSGPTLEVEGLTKTFGRSVVAVKDLSFSVQPGRVTGFLGPNGSGKTTTLRCMLGLVRPSAGRAVIGGLAYADLDNPMGIVGGALEASGFHPGRTGRNHLRVLATAAGVPLGRADEMLEFVGLASAGRRRVVEYSLGMRQRLALAGALIGNPGALILDEPANGLDPEGIAWLRTFLRAQAAAGATVLVSSHALAEIQQTVDDVVIINRGELVHAGPLAGLSGHDGGRVIVRSPQAEALMAALAEAGGRTAPREDGSWLVTGLSAAEVGHAAHEGGFELHQLSTEADDLERLFLEMTGGAQ
jgi:ABC-2 type transport system ATP-binding protein